MLTSPTMHVGWQYCTLPCYQTYVVLYSIAGLRIADISQIKQKTVAEVRLLQTKTTSQVDFSSLRTLMLILQSGYFDVAPETDDPSFVGAWSTYMHPSGVIAVSR